MKRFLHLRFLSVIMLMLCGIGSSWAEETITFSSSTGLTNEGTNCTLVFAKNTGTTNPTWNANSSEYRLYAKGSLTITAKNNHKLSRIVFDYVLNKGGRNKVAPTPTITSGFDSETKTWKSSQPNGDESVVLTAEGTAGNIGFKKVTVYYVDEGTQATSYTITYDANKPTGVTANVEGMPSNGTSGNGTFTLSNSTPTLEGYTFKGWGATADATTPITSVTINNANVTVYALWEEVVSNDPYITTETTSLDFGTVKYLTEANTVKTIDVTYGNLTGEITASLTSGTAFEVESQFDEGVDVVSVTLTATDEGTYNDVLTIGDGETSITIPVSATIATPEPSITCDGTEMMDMSGGEQPVKMLGAMIVGQSKTIHITATDIESDIIYMLDQEDESPFTVTGELTREGGDLTVTLNENADLDEAWAADVLKLMYNETHTYFYLVCEPKSLGSLTAEELTADDFKEGTSYTPFTGVAKDLAIYAGSTAKNKQNNQYYIQIKSNDSNTGFVTTSSKGYVRAITVQWEPSTSGEVDVYGDVTPYASADNLYATTANGNKVKGTKIASFTNGTEETIFIDGDYPYIGFRSKNGMVYLTKVTVYWEPVSTELRVVDNAGLATFSSPFAIDVTGKKAYIVETVGENSATLTSVTGVVAPGTGLMIDASAGVEFTVVDNDENATAYADNYLKPAFKGTEIPCTDATTVRYVYGKKPADTNYAFHKLVTTNMANNKGNLAYLEVPVATQQSAPARLNLVLPEATDIETVQSTECRVQNGVYNLNGQKVSSDFRGIVIVNGKKIVK